MIKLTSNNNSLFDGSFYFKDHDECTRLLIR